MAKLTAIEASAILFKIKLTTTTLDENNYMGDTLNQV